MTLWILVSAERSKLIIMPIRDKKKIPVFVGELEIRKSPTGVRPHKFRVDKNGNEELRPPSELIDLLRIADRIMLAKGSDQQQSSSFMDMLQDFQLSADVVNACRFCLLNYRFNFLNRKSIKYHNEKICEDCAIDELHRTFRTSQ